MEEGTSASGEAPSTEVTEPAGPVFADYSDDGLTVRSVDPERYVGLWYEIATTGSFQQQSCTGTTATYSPIDDITLEVYNRCYLGELDGPLSEILGTATAKDESFARLEVDFGFGFPAPYDIVELDDAPGDEPYAFAAVSSFAGAQVWILAREPQLDAEVYDALVERLDDRGYEASDRLIPTTQPDAR